MNLFYFIFHEEITDLNRNISFGTLQMTGGIFRVIYDKTNVCK